MSSENIARLAGVLLSLACSFLPGLSSKWAGLDGDTKRAITLGLMVAVAVGAFGAGCAGFGPITCDKQSAVGLFETLIAALTANQAVYAVTPAIKRRLTVKAGAASIEK